jgi:hypothetical protein
MGLNFSFSALLASFIFGIFGIYLFRLGKKRSHGLLIAVAVALMIYPYFIESELLIWLTGAVLTFVGYRLAL